MPRLNNLECSIHTDKGPIKEYPATATHFDNEDFPCKTVYIQPEAGKHFKIEFTAHYYVPPAGDPKYDCLGIQISCDGHTEKYCSLTDSMWWRVSGRCRSPVVRSIAGYQTAPHVLKRYIFSPIQTTEERCKRAEGVGEICVFIIRVNMGDACEVNWPNSEPASVGNLFERDFKVLGCVTGYV